MPKTLLAVLFQILLLLPEGIAYAQHSPADSLEVQRGKRSVGYSLPGVGSANIRYRNGSDFVRMLGGQVPGVNVTATGGMTGSGTNIIIRGYTTINISNDPLFIVDGIYFDGTAQSTSGMFSGGGSLTTPNRFLDLDPGNIRDITVLKGLSASVLYGEKGRNGVILVTTKSGSFAGDTSQGWEVTLDQSVYATQIASRPDYQDIYGGGFEQNFGWFFSSWGPAFDTDDSGPFGSDFRGFADDGTVLIRHPLSNHTPTAAAFPELANENYRYEARTGPVEAFFRTGMASTSRVSINGGTQDIRLNVHFSRAGEEGFTPNNDLVRNSFGMGASYAISPRMKAQTTLNMSLTDVQSPPLAAAGGSGPVFGNGTHSIFADLFYTSRSIDLDLPHRNPTTGGSAYYRSINDIPHPRWVAGNVKVLNNAGRYFGKTELNYEVTEGVNIRYRLGYDNFTENQQYRQNPGGVRPDALSGGFFQTIEQERISWDHNINILLNFQLTESLSLKGTTGAQYLIERNTRQGVESHRMIVPGFFQHSNFRNQSATNFFNGLDFQQLIERETAGVFGEMTLGYRDVIYLSMAGRNDWISTLEVENRSIFHPSVNLSYLVSDHLDIASDLLTHLRFFAGTGSSAGSPDPYSTRNAYGLDTGGFIGNPDLKPERYTEYEGGVDVRFLNGRLGLVAQAYTRTTTDLIAQTPPTFENGFVPILDNIGEIRNRGVEVVMDGIPATGELRWDVQAGFFTSDSEVIELGAGLGRIQVGAGLTTRGNFAIPGEPFMVMMGSKILRVTEELRQANPVFADVPVGTPIIGSGGDYLPDPGIGIIGDPNPDWEASLINTFRYKGASLSFRFDYQQGGDMYSSWIGALLGRGVTTATTAVDRAEPHILDGVKIDGQPNDIEISQTRAYFNNIGFGADELRVYDMTHIRLAHVALSYDLPVTLLTGIPFKQVTLSLSADNVWMHAFNIPEGIGFDPNVTSTGAGVNSRGFDYLTGPAARRFGGHLRVRF